MRTRVNRLQWLTLKTAQGYFVRFLFLEMAHESYSSVDEKCINTAPFDC